MTNEQDKHQHDRKIDDHTSEVFVQVDGTKLNTSSDHEIAKDLKIAHTTPADPLGVWHTSVIHFPIAWLFLLFFAEIGCLIHRSLTCHRLIRHKRTTRITQHPKWLPVLRWFVCLAFIPAILTGLVHAGILSIGETNMPRFILPDDLAAPANHDLKEHLVGTLLSGLFLSIATLLSTMSCRNGAQGVQGHMTTTLQKLCYIGYCGFLTASLFFLIEGAHHGGELTHGDDVPSCSMR